MTGVTALLLFAAFTIVVMAIYVLPRVFWVLTMKKSPTNWTRGKPNDDSPLLIRAQHAHMNCVENLPVYGAIVVAAHLLGKNAVVDSVAVFFLAARVAQSLVHLASTAPAMVFLRANFFIAQLGLYAYMLWGLLG